MTEAKVTDAFLSRLCGGEEFLSLPNGIAHFLSRLCGGEEYSFAQQWFWIFLSRLCGGEAI